MNAPLFPLSAWRFTAILFSVALVSVRADQTAERTLNGEIAATTRSVRIDHVSGPVSIVGAESNFGWKWTMSVTADEMKNAEAALKECEIEVKETAGTLDLRLILPDRRRHEGNFSLFGLFSWSWHEGVNLRSQLELRLPKSVAAEVRNRFGSTRIAALDGSLEIDCQNGRLELEDLGGAVSASTSFSSLQARNLHTATLHNQNGNIDIARVTGELKASTSFGRMTAHDIKGRADLKNQNGSIEVRDVEGDVVAATSFGRLTANDIHGSADLRNQNSAIEAHDVANNLTAATSFSSLRATDIGGWASLNCRNGRVEAARIGKDLRASNTFAPLQVQEVHGAADLESQNGGIAATAVDGDIRAQTSFGRIELDGAGRRFDARSQNGPVTITARSPAVERIAASASFAAINVRLPEQLQPVIRASTSFGKVHSDYPVLLADSVSDSKFYANASGPKIDLRGQNGDIRIRSLIAR